MKSAFLGLEFSHDGWSLVMVISFAVLYKLAVECGVGIAVLVRCFTNKRATELQIADRLGDGFSRAPFATIVVCINNI